jgi:putative ABC transport system substrate-binding protein
LLRTYVIALAIVGAMSAVRVQAAEIRHVGVLLVGRSTDSKDAQQLRHGLLEAGYVEGRDIAIEWRSANGDSTQIDRLAADLIQRKVDVIVVDSTLATQVLKRDTSSIPVVMALVADPVGSGLVTNFGHPGGNITGLARSDNSPGYRLPQVELHPAGSSDKPYADCICITKM